MTRPRDRARRSLEDALAPPLFVRRRRTLRAAERARHLVRAALSPRERPAGRALLVLLTSLGELDWIAPVLAEVVARAPDVRPVGYATNDDVRAKLRRAPDLRALFPGPVHLSGGELALNLRRPDVALALLPDDPPEPAIRRLLDQVPSAPRVTFPSGTALLSRADDPKARFEAYFGATPPDFPRIDACLVGGPHLRPFYEFTLPGVRQIDAGMPRYESAWRARVPAAPPSSAEARFAAEAEACVLFISRAPHPTYLDEAAHAALVAELYAALDARPTLRVLHKPHPREPAHSRIAHPRLRATNRPLMQLAPLAKLTVSMFSSGVLDAIAVGTPVFEHYRYPDGGLVLEFRERNGARVSVYEELGLVENLGTAGRLGAVLDRALGGDRFEPLVAAQAQALEAASGGPGGTARAADALLDFSEVR